MAMTAEPEDRDNVTPLDSTDDEDIDVDLDAMQDEAAGTPTTVKLDGTIIHIQHAGDWTSTAMRAASSGDWDAWARSVILDDIEYQVWEDADLTNNQVEAVFTQCGRSARMSAGKSQKRTGSRRSTRRK
jgi:hypothetical protein